MRLFRPLAVCTQVRGAGAALEPHARHLARNMPAWCPARCCPAAQALGAAYLAWRALRTLRPGWGYAYSVPWWCAEFTAHCLSYCFIAGLFYMVR